MRLITAHTDTRMLEQSYNRASALDVESTITDAVPAALLQDIPMPINQKNAKYLPALPEDPAARTAILAQIKSVMRGLAAEEKKNRLDQLLSGFDL